MDDKSVKILHEQKLIACLFVFVCVCRSRHCSACQGFFPSQVLKPNAKKAGVFLFPGVDDVQFVEKMLAATHVTLIVTGQLRDFISPKLDPVLNSFMNKKLNL
jgi:hypothetical protein